MKDDGFNPVQDFVRVGVKSGGCSGLSYELKFDSNQLDEDRLFEDNGVKILVDKKSLLYLVGTTLDYSGGLNGKGFVLIIQMQIEPVGVVKVFPFNRKKVGFLNINYYIY